MSESTAYAVDAALDGSSNRHRSGVSCRGCDARLPLRLADDGEEPALWECGRCGSRLAGLPVSHIPLPINLELRLADVHFDDTQLPPAPAVLHQLARQFTPSPPEYKGPDRRRLTRTTRRLNLLVTPLNDIFSPVGPCIRAVAYDLSSQGIGLLSTAAITSPKLAISIAQYDRRPIQLIARVCRVQALLGDFHRVGVELIHRLGG
jgi:hypothetical protein